MRLVYFTHSLSSCWNHGNAHFLRGVLRELIASGQDVRVFEPAGSWSLTNLLRDHGPDGLAAYRAAYPDLSSSTYATRDEVEEAVDGADVVVVHEWNEAWVTRALAELRQRNRFLLLFHDTHHRLISAKDTMPLQDLEQFDGILAFGRSLAEAYGRLGWGRMVFVWHEAADTRLFHPIDVGGRAGLVWIGNWGDEERSAELGTYLLEPATAAGLPLDIFGVRYSPEAIAEIEKHGARYRGWLPNAEAPQTFARYLATVHVPRRFYVEHLPGIPTIRVFEALACGIPLLSAPWSDTEHLFSPGKDFLMAPNASEMTRMMRSIAEDGELRTELAANGLATIRARHTCAHRAAELLGILRSLSDQPAATVAA